MALGKTIRRYRVWIALGVVALVFWGLAAWQILRRAPSPLTILHVFSLSSRGATDGVTPIVLFLGQDGALYGATYDGGSYGGGTIFRIDPRNGHFHVIYRFNPKATSDSHPKALMQASNGRLYGICRHQQCERLFSVLPDGSDFKVLHDFTPSQNMLPSLSYQASIRALDLLEGPDRFLYGMSALYDRSIANDQYTVYKIALDGSHYRVLRQFIAQPLLSRRLLLTDGKMLYGWIHANNVLPNSLFQMSFDGKYWRILPWPSQLTPPDMVSSSLLLLNGTCYCWEQVVDGTALYRLPLDGSATRNSLVSQTLKPLLHVSGVPPACVPSILLGGGSISSNSLIVGSDGALYGVFYQQRDKNTEGSVIFRVNTDGTHFRIAYQVFWPLSDTSPFEKILQFLHLSSHHLSPSSSKVFEPVSLLWGGNNTLYGIAMVAGGYAIFRLQVPSS